MCAPGTLNVLSGEMMDDQDDLVFMLRQPDFSTRQLHLPSGFAADTLFSGEQVVVVGQLLQGEHEIQVSSIRMLTARRLLSEEAEHSGAAAAQRNLLATATGPGAPTTLAVAAAAAMKAQAVVTDVPTLYIIAGICDAQPAMSVQVCMWGGVGRGRGQWLSWAHLHRGVRGGGGCQRQPAERTYCQRGLWGRGGWGQAAAYQGDP